MTTLKASLLERKSEIQSHLALALALERHLIEADVVSIGETALSVRHISNIKSGIIIHIYNIVEATMSQTINQIGNAVVSTTPSEWSHETIKEWLRKYASISIDGNEDTRLDVVHGAALKLLSRHPMGELEFKKPSGTWSDENILLFARRLNVNFRLNESVARKIRADPRYGEKTPLVFLAKRRNAIAHGSRSFEDGANDLTLNDIRNLVEITLAYMELAVEAFQAYIDDKRFKAEA